MDIGPLLGVSDKVNLNSEIGRCGLIVRVGGREGSCALFTCVRTSYSFFFTLATGPRRSLRLKLSDTRVYEPQIRARLGTTAHRNRTRYTGCRGARSSCPRPSRTVIWSVYIHSVNILPLFSTPDAYIDWITVVY